MQPMVICDLSWFVQVTGRAKRGKCSWPWEIDTLDLVSIMTAGMRVWMLFCRGRTLRRGRHVRSHKKTDSLAFAS